MYVSERIVNIAELENHIQNAYVSSISLKEELQSNRPDSKKVKILIDYIAEELQNAYDFDFHIERRTTI